MKRIRSGESGIRGAGPVTNLLQVASLPHGFRDVRLLQAVVSIGVRIGLGSFGNFTVRRGICNWLHWFRFRAGGVGLEFAQ